MDVKQEPSDILEGFTIKTEPGVFETEPSKFCYSEDTVFENVQMFPKTFKQELVNIGDVKKLKETDISDIKQEVDEYLQQKTESELSELLTSHCDIPTLKIESTSDLGQCTSKSLENTAKKKRRYACPICQKSIPSPSSRSTHIDRHFMRRYVVCQFCGISLKKNEFFQHFFIHSVKNRTKNHIDDKPLKELQQKSIDNVHDKLFSSFKTFNDGSNLQIFTKTYKCDICSKSFKYKNNLRRHFLTIHNGEHSEQSFECGICSKCFTRKTSLEEHLLYHSGKKPFKCNICYKCFRRKSNLRRHLTIHSGDKPFECNICSKGFSDTYGLRQHLLIHNSEKPFKCDICSKGFNQKCGLKQHSFIHSCEKPIKCDICFKGFRCKSSLRLHLAIHSDEFQCEICSKCFNRKSDLRTHLFVHSSKKILECNICSKGFDNKFGLRQHLIIHSDEKPFKCEICSKDFKFKSNLERHLTIHSGEKPFKCNVCSKCFNRKSHLQRHLAIHSDKPLE